MFKTNYDVFTVAGSQTIPIASQAVVYTASKAIGYGSAFSLWEILSGSSPNVKVELQVSLTAPAALEEIADSSGTDWCIPDGASPIWTALVDNVLHSIVISPLDCIYVRLKLTGNAGNGAGVTGVFKVASQQQISC